MSAPPHTPATSPQSPAARTATSPTGGRIWRAVRAPLLVAALLTLVAAITVLFTGGDGQARYLDPEDGTLRGGKALAQLLRAHGVQVDRVDSAEQAAALPGDRLVLVTGNVDPANPGALAALPGDRVVDARNLHLDLLAPAVEPARDPARERTREPECDLPAATAAGSAYLGGQPLDPPAGATACYPSRGKPTLVQYHDGQRTVTVLSSTTFMTNQRLDEDGNAALALNLLGAKRAVTWLVPPPAEPGDAQPPGGGSRSFHDLMPESIGWGLRMALVALLVTVVWRARRLGPVVAERLPVVVRAAETVEGRGGLYRARRARGQAAAALRAGTLDRIVPRLGLTGDSPPHAVVSAVAVRTGLDPQQIGGALYGTAPADDGGLVGLARYLEQLERQIIEH
ncbi:DUF4350 domain-containing protein [Nonomuraea sp. NPDC050310]|uniref:DUF4350 domain-containing protein n=1 Tax=Nonomuraea sp. NPDC050310 TaxID=3154935 RepID=UPI0033D1A534